MVSSELRCFPPPFWPKSHSPSPLRADGPLLRYRRPSEPRTSAAVVSSPSAISSPPTSSLSPSLHHLAQRLPNTTPVLSLPEKIHRSPSPVAPYPRAPTTLDALPHCAEAPGRPGHFSLWGRPLPQGRGQ
jgi:hypothetical protein